MISFYNQEISYQPSNKSGLRKWIADVLSSYGFLPGHINYIFCSDPALLEVNMQFLGHDYYTDIITFDTSDDYPRMRGKICGDIFISLDTVKANAVEYGAGFTDELHRVMIHGVLHLVGIDDQSEEDFLKMKEAENRALSLRTFLTVAEK